MTWKCPECDETIEYDEISLAKKGNPVCPSCDSDMVLQELKNYSFRIMSGDERIVHEFEIEAKDEDEASSKADDEYVDFVASLHLEQE
jgi:transcription initiation factor IIE alpha subunit